MIKYVIISPVRNEEEYVGKTIDSVIKQTILPVEWIMVNDGSSDKTAEIITRYMLQYPWIKLINLKDRGFYYPGTGVVHVFQKGLEQVLTNNWDFLVKLDCDLEFRNDYFEQIFAEFIINPRLGIASGCTYKPVKGDLVRESAQPDHPCGASKVYRKDCWKEIGGLLPVPGWDLADILKARMLKWDTRCFFELKLTHFRPGGSRRKGLVKPKFLQGRFEYRHGYSFFYTFLKASKNIFSKPVVIGSIGKVAGYIWAFASRDPYLFDPEMRKFLRSKHREYIFKKLKAS